MRTIFTLLLGLIMMDLYAQVPIEVKIEQRPSSLGVQPAFEVMVPQATADDAVALWKKTILPGGLFKKEPKMEKVKDEWVVNNVLITDIAVRPLNVFTQVNSFPGNIYVRIFLQTENGFLGSPDSVVGDVDAASRFIRNYAVELYRQAVEKELRKEEKELKELENNLTRLEKQNRNLSEKISDAEKDETDLKNEARQNDELLKNQQNVITLDNTDPNAKNAREQLEKQTKDTEKDIEKSQKDQIKFTKKVSKNEREQRSKTSDLEKQKMRVEEVKKKLNNIK